MTMMVAQKDQISNISEMTWQPRPLGMISYFSRRRRNISVKVAAIWVQLPKPHHLSSYFSFFNFLKTCIHTFFRGILAGLGSIWAEWISIFYVVFFMNVWFCFREKMRKITQNHVTFCDFLRLSERRLLPLWNVNLSVSISIQS